MVRLVFHTNIFGPLHFEYNDAVVRAGMSSDNDLVIRHPSVKAQHCILIFHDERVSMVPYVEGMLLPPEGPLPEGTAYSIGDTLFLGELPFLVERSPNSVAVATEKPKPIDNGKTPEGYWKAQATAVPAPARWFCGRCDIRLLDSQVRVIGLKGKKKHGHCPVCGRVVELLGRNLKPKGFAARLRYAWRNAWAQALCFLFPPRAE